jgi:hypothetical protein
MTWRLIAGPIGGELVRGPAGEAYHLDAPRDRRPVSGAREGVIHPEQYTNLACPAVAVAVLFSYAGYVLRRQ